MTCWGSAAAPYKSPSVLLPMPAVIFGSIDMSLVSFMIKATKGAAAGVAVLTALPVFGAVGTITAAGLAVGAILGGTAGVFDGVQETAAKRS